MGVLSGYGRDLMQCLKVPVESIYSMPNLRQWFVESTLYSVYRWRYRAP